MVQIISENISSCFEAVYGDMLCPYDSFYYLLLTKNKVELNRIVFLFRLYIGLYSARTTHSTTPNYY
jgi:hypothetical protein